jgi:hypothetical protein
VLKAAEQLATPPPMPPPAPEPAQPAPPPPPPAAPVAQPPPPPPTPAAATPAAAVAPAPEAEQRKAELESEAALLAGQPAASDSQLDVLQQTELASPESSFPTVSLAPTTSGKCLDLALPAQATAVASCQPMLAPLPAACPFAQCSPGVSRCHPPAHRLLPSRHCQRASRPGHRAFAGWQCRLLSRPVCPRAGRPASR